jgi:ribosomal protein S18 acetylase RimI-like enzyme
MSAFAIEPLAAAPKTLAALNEILIETVAAGGSVTFMHPLAVDAAAAFWDGALTAAGRGERIILGAFDDGVLVATVSLLLDCPQNQPHRAEIAKMMTRPSHRGRGAASALLREAERLATAHRRTLLTLDTAEEEGASGFYEMLGYTLAGTIPDYALKPHGGLTGAMFYWKRIGAAATLRK